MLIKQILFSRESVFSDLNNPRIVSTTTNSYTDSFGFTWEEVEDALREYGLEDQQQEVKDWYDGFCFGERKEIYNPWSVLNYLKEKRLAAYWANTSGNRLVNQLIQKGNILLASGYLKADAAQMDKKSGKTAYELMLTNREVRLMFEGMIEDWFSESVPAYNDFIRAMGLCSVLW